jgi:hypothetical protein
MVECEGKNAQVKISSFNGYLFFLFCHPKKQFQYFFVIQKPPLAKKPLPIL